jgi:hypothetical protein
MSNTLLTITPISATSILFINISANMQISNVALNQTFGYCNCYEGTVATAITNGTRFVFATTTTIGAAAGGTVNFSLRVASVGTAARSFGLSAATNVVTATVTVGNIQGYITEIQL